MLANKLFKVDGNHAITLIKDNNKMFAYDPTNLLVYTFLIKTLEKLLMVKDLLNYYQCLL